MQIETKKNYKFPKLKTQLVNETLSNFGAQSDILFVWSCDSAFIFSAITILDRLAPCATTRNW